MTFTVRQRPCQTCPYRRDVPSGIWAASEYGKLPGYDGDIPEQAAAGATGLFFCHSAPDFLCAGWAGCHDMGNNLAVRLHWRDLDDSVWDYESPVPLFASGAGAAAHGMRDIQAPEDDARAGIESLLRLQAARNQGRA